MRPEALFLETLRDLEQRVTAALRHLHAGTGGDSASEYHALMIAVLLRKLLLDGRPLVDVVNRHHQLRIRYPVDHWPVLSGTSSPGVSVTVLPRPVRDPPLYDPRVLPLLLDEFLDTDDMTAAQLLAKPVLAWNDARVTARELILHVAHVEGAVHVGEPTDARGRTISQVTAIVGYGKYPAVLVCLAAIGRVVLLGLAPLRDKVSNSTA